MSGSRCSRIFFALVCVHLQLCAAKSVRTHQEGNDKDNLFEVLSSIDKHLARLDETHSARAAEMFEKRIDRLEAALKLHADSPKGPRPDEGNMKNVNEIAARIDTICERTQHRLMHLELKIELAEKKLSEKMDILMSRFEKMEETLTTRESDIEEQIGEVLAVVEELKIPNDSSSMEMMIKANTEAIRKSNEKLEEMKDSLQNTEEIDEEVHTDIKQMAEILNITRNEQRNSFRNLIVQVGRIGGKNSICNSNLEMDQLRNLNETIHSSLESVFTLQNLFYESCHRIRLDEEQIEAKISEVLEKLIDAMQQRDLENNLKSIEQLLKVHDANIRRNIISNSHNLGVLFQKDKKTKDEQKIKMDKIDNLIGEIKEKLEEISRTETMKTNHNRTLCAIAVKNLEDGDNTKGQN